MVKSGCVMSAAGMMAMSIPLFTGSLFAGEVVQRPRPNVPTRTAQAASPPPQDTTSSSRSVEPSMESATVEDLLLEKGSITMDDWIRIKAEEEYKLAEREKRNEALEGWKSKIENLPILTEKINIGLNALQWQYFHTNAHPGGADGGEGKGADQLFIRRSEIIFWGKISENLPRWHALFEFQSIGNQNITPSTPSGTSPGSIGTFFRESYIDYRPVVSWAPYLNFFRMGVFRMPWGIFTETSGGLRDVISSPYLTTVGSGGPSPLGTAGTIDFLQERDLFIDARGRLFNRFEYAMGIMNGNNFTANNASGNNLLGDNNSQKDFYGRWRFFLTDISWVSFTAIAGESNNAGTNINGRGKGNYDRFGVDFRYMSKLFPGFMIQGEAWQGHDASNATAVGLGANGACLNRAICGGSGAPGQVRRTWYVLAKYLISEGPLRNLEPTVMYEQFDPSASTSNDLYTRAILGLNYYFENLPPKIQSKLQINYEFRHHQGLGPNVPYDSRSDVFGQNAILVQLQVRYM
ncbi:MAG: hypothetical protein ACREJU_08230 [Nitrospiraceae bacterium]